MIHDRLTLRDSEKKSVGKVVHEIHGELISIFQLKKCKVKSEIWERE